MDIDTPEMRAKRAEAQAALEKKARQMKRVQRWDCLAPTRMMPKASVPGSIRRRMAREAAAKGRDR